MLARRTGIQTLALVAGIFASCDLRPARYRVEGDLVREVDFQGNGGPFSTQSDYALRRQIEAQGSPWGVLSFWPLNAREPTPYHPDLLIPDSYRLEIWYAHHGWFDARVEGWEVLRVRKQKKRRAGAVDVVGVVSPGLRSAFRNIEIEGLGRGIGGIGRAVLRTSYVHEDEPFDLESVLETKDALRDRLLDHGHAYASVDLKMTARPEEQAVDVKFVATPGIATQIGEIRVSGNERIDEAVIRDELALTEGQPYKVEDLRKAQRHLFDLGTFSIVNVTPVLDDPTAKLVPIDVSVTETRFRTLRLGGGLEYDGVSFMPRVSVTLSHVNLFDALVRGEAHGELGYATDFQRTGQPVYDASIALAHPRVFGTRKYALVAKGEVVQDLQAGQFAYFNPRVDVGLTWRATDDIVVNLGPHAEVYRFLAMTGPAKLTARRLFGEEFQNPYRLTTFDINTTIDWRDDPLFPRRGRYLQAGVRQAIPFAANDFFYTEFNADVRGYRPIRLPRRVKSKVVRGMTPDVISARGRAQVLQSWASSPLPFPERAFLGGGTDHRGFKLDQVGSYDCLCQYESAEEGSFSGTPGAGLDVDRFYVPKGGSIAGVVSGEVRYEVLGSASVVAFGDVGLLADGWSDVSGDRLRVGFGVGGRYKSSIGPIRFDLGFRPLYPEDEGPTEFVNCNLADRLPRSFDLISLPSGSRDLSDRSVPLAINFFLGIGEAI